MTLHHFLILRIVLPLRVMEDRFFLNYYVCEDFSSEMKSVRFMRLEKG